MRMKIMLMMALMSFASATLAADCVTNSRGKTVCSNGEKAVVVNSNTGTVTTAERNSGGVTTVQGSTATKTAVNHRTGNAAVAQTNQNGVTTTKTAPGRRSQDQEWHGRGRRPQRHRLRQGQEQPRLHEEIAETAATLTGRSRPAATRYRG